MAEHILEEYLLNAQNESNLSITSNNINIELSNEFLEELRKNAYHGWIDEGVVNHIAKVLEMIDLIHIPGVDSHQLRMKVCPLSLADDVRQWWINDGEEKSQCGKNLLRTFLLRDDSILISNNTTTDSFSKPYLITRGKINTEKEDKQSQTKNMNKSRSVVAKTVVAACCYYIWQERNFRLFKNLKRSPQQVIDCIKVTVRLKLLSCYFKKSKDAMEVIHLWELPNSILR
ncbi:hypothetical protein Tco_0418886 [Tanacetum coccineum]